MYFIQMQHRDRRGPITPFFKGKGAEVAVLWQPPPNPTPLGKAAAEGGLPPFWAKWRRLPPPPSRAKRSSQSDVVHRVPPQQAAGAASLSKARRSVKRKRA